MFLEITTEDPLNVLSSTKKVVENARFVSLDPSKIKDLAKQVESKIESGLEEPEEHLGTKGNLKDNIQLVFIEEVVNFYFWAEKDKEKWRVEWQGKEIMGGWYGLKTCFERAIGEGVPILNPGYLVNISKQDVANLFRSSNDVEIPLLNERINNFRQAGKILLEKYQGHFLNVIEESNYNAIELVKLIYQNFPSFRDIHKLDEQEVFFLKRAQISTHDLNRVLVKQGKELKDMDKITACSDYKLPQMLRIYGVMEYNQGLSEKVDNYVLIPSASREEIEIRAATIWGIELIRQELEKYTASDIDFALWLMSQTKSKQAKPYHRTYSIYY